MNKWKYAFIFVLPLVFTGCTAENTNLITEKKQLEQDIETLKKEKQLIENMIVEEKIEKDIESYIVTFQLKQTHVSLNLATHAKDALNKAEFDVVVSEDYYNSVSIGDIINNDFRVGSAVLKGSFGKWEVSVIDKKVK